MRKKAYYSFAVMLALGAVFAWAVVISAGPGMDSRRVVRIGMPESLEHFTRPFALFDHEGHAVAGGTAGCPECHGTGSDGIFKSKVVEYSQNDDPEKVTREYHEFCDRCHGKESEKPLDCDGCHDTAKLYRASQWTAPEITLAQHDKMIKYVNGDCAQCHHGYAKEKIDGGERFEFLCRACHLSSATPGAQSMKQVAHTTCISCHIKAIKDVGRGGPTECAPCHPGAGAKMKYVVDMSEVPRLEAGQKDSVYLKVEGATMGGVTFNHKGHEEDVRSCRTCHHKSMQDCSNCHTLTEATGGGGMITPEAFMELNSPHSCIGCHERQKKKNRCSYCHSGMPARASDNSCAVCHAEENPEAAEKKILAAEPDGSVPENLPDSFMVGEGATNFEPVFFPHGMIIKTLRADIGKSSLAGAFHEGHNVICQKCHHTSGESGTYDKCSSCHPLKASKAGKGKISMAEALNIMCVECHPDRHKKAG